MNEHINEYMRSYFTHVAFMIALENEWDMETTAWEFWSNLCKESPKKALAPYVYLVQEDGSKKEFTCNQVFDAAKGFDSPGLNAYADAVIRSVESQPDVTFSTTDIVAQSMHSGSSAYLYLSDILEYMEKL